MLNLTLNRLVAKVSGRVRLRSVLIVPFVVQLVGTVGLVGYLSFRSGQQAVNDLATKLRSEVTARINQHLDTYLAIPHQINQINVDAIDLGLLDVKNSQTTGSYFWKQLQVYQNIGYISFGSKTGEFVGAGRYPNGIMEISETSGAIGSKNYTYQTDSQGNRLTPPRIDNNYQFQKEAWYVDTVLAGKPVWSHIYSWEGYPQYISISHSYPVYDKTNALLGIISVDLQLSQINDFLRQLKVSPSGKTFILERNGLLVASSSTNQPELLIDGKAQRLPALKSSDVLIRATTEYLYKRFANFKEIKTTQQLNFRQDGQRDFIQVTPYQDQFGLDWLIVVVVPEADFMEQINTNTKTTILLCLAALSVAIVIGILTSRWVIQPIVYLNIAAKQIANGEWDKPVNLKRSDELGELGKSFNRMATELQASFAHMKDLYEELSLSENRLTEFLEAVPVGVCVHDATGKITYANQTAQQLLGRETLFQVGSDKLAEVYQIYRTGTEQLYPTAELPFVRALAGETCNADDLELHQPDRVIPLEVWTTPIYDETGQVVYAIAAFQNITERKQAIALLANYNRTLEEQIAERTEALRQSEERWQLAIQGSSDGIWDQNLLTNEHFLSPRCLAILGYADDEISNFEQWVSYIYPDDFAPLQEAFQRHLNRETPYYTFEYRIRGKDGSYKWLLTRGQALWDNQGNPVRVVGSLTDITDRKKAEETLRQSEAREREKSQELEQILNKLKHTQAQLIQTEKMSSLGRIAAGIAHEINNPVSFIKGNLIYAKQYSQDLSHLIELYQQAYPNPPSDIQQLIDEIDLEFLVEDWSKLMDSMQVGAERIRTIVLSLKSFSRLDESELKPVDIHESIDNTLLILQHQLKAEDGKPGIEVIKNYGQLPRVTCYASQLNQVFINLLNNAIDALESQPSPREITIRTETRQKAQENFSFVTSSLSPDFVVIRIFDNGCGMSEEVLQKIFEPFFTTKAVGSGTGLGLSTCYQIVVERHQGKLSCVSAPGKGTEFVVEIPVIYKAQS